MDSFVIKKENRNFPEKQHRTDGNVELFLVFLFVDVIFLYHVFFRKSYFLLRLQVPCVFCEVE